MSNRNTLFILLALIMTLFSCKKEQGCTDVTACNYSSSAEEDDDSCYKPGDDCNDENTNTINDTYSNDCECVGVLIFLGCTDNTACNYNENANTDDETCVFPGDECDDNSPDTFNDSYASNCECIGSLIYEGCTDNTACNFIESANTDDGSCAFPGDECDDNSANTFNDLYTSNCECNGIVIYPGCTENNACNYNENANTDDGSCAFPGDGCDDNNPNTINDSYTLNCECIGALIYEGCTENNACNYNENANTDDNTCYFPGDSCNDGDDSSVEDVWDVSCECNGQGCDINDDGNPTIIYGLYTGEYPIDELNLVSILYLTPQENYLLTPWQPATEANSENVWEYSGGETGAWGQTGPSPPGGEWAIYALAGGDVDSPSPPMIGAYYFVGCYINGTPYNDYLIPYTNWDPGPNVWGAPQNYYQPFSFN